MSERYLRQFIRETVLLESKRIDEALGSMLAAKKIANSRNSSSSKSSSNRRGSSKEYSYYGSDHPLGSWKSEPEPISQEREIVKKEYALTDASGNYRWHVQSNWPDYMDWKEWLYEHEDGEYNINDIIKKQGNKYVINPDSIGDPKDGKFEQAFINRLEKLYEEEKQWALDRVRISKYKGY
jgi:hypothetical protein